MREDFHTLAVCQEHARLVDAGQRRIGPWWKMKPGAQVMECSECGWWWRRDDLYVEDIEPYDTGRQLDLFGDSHAA